MNQTGEQWDFPNAWPPLQSFLVLGLYRTGTKEAVEYAETLARRWLMANYIGYEETGKMFEKVSFPCFFMYVYVSLNVRGNTLNFSTRVRDRKDSSKNIFLPKNRDDILVHNVIESNIRSDTKLVHTVSVCVHV